MAFDTLQLVSDISLRWIYDCGQYMPTDFLVYLLAVDEKGRIVRVDEQTGPLPPPPPDSSHVHIPLSSRFPAVAGTMADSLNLDPVLMEHSPDNGFGML
ncbi:hypothetical protein ALC56_02063 [Trachymyrmex septentrionalis]|uniref:Uncharacterized protein n=1 Tax=Trachymyrmex septentrionalis TaxID=34720 RepID=A0A195FT69_9HYME|nr:hypothetical protein ALC56_02063 [Trachymyrmex septentrionalis]